MCVQEKMSVSNGKIVFVVFIKQCVFVRDTTREEERELENREIWESFGA